MAKSDVAKFQKEADNVTKKINKLDAQLKRQALKRKKSRLQRDVARLRKKEKLINLRQRRRVLRRKTSLARRTARALEGGPAQRRRRKRLPKVRFNFGGERRKLKRMV